MTRGVGVVGFACDTTVVGFDCLVRDGTFVGVGDQAIVGISVGVWDGLGVLDGVKVKVDVAVGVWLGVSVFVGGKGVGVLVCVDV